MGLRTRIYVQSSNFQTFANFSDLGYKVDVPTNFINFDFEKNSSLKNILLNNVKPSWTKNLNEKPSRFWCGCQGCHITHCRYRVLEIKMWIILESGNIFLSVNSFFLLYSRLLVCWNIQSSFGNGRFTYFESS